MSQDAPRVLVPPRPNLGPEPWPYPVDQAPWPLWVAVISTLGLLLPLTAWLLRRRLRRSRTRFLSYHPSAADGSPRTRVLQLADEARQVLATRFGVVMRAKTTEELSDDSSIKEAIGPDGFDSLINLLAAADLWKFAPPSGNGHHELPTGQLDGWEAVLRTLGDTKSRRSETSHR